MKTSPEALLKEEEEEKDAGKGNGGVLRKVLLVDALPLGILSIAVVVFVYAGGAIFQKLEEHTEDA